MEVGMARFDLTDFEWSVISPLLPNKPRGVARVDDRRVLNGIFWRLRTGAPWAGIPEGCGPASIRVHQHAANAKKRRSILLHGSVAGRPNDKDPCACRCRRPAACFETDRRPGPWRGAGKRPVGG